MHYVTSRGVLNPRPTFLVYRSLPAFALLPFLFKKIVGCFWKAFSFYRTKCKGIEGYNQHATFSVIKYMGNSTVHDSFHFTGSRQWCNRLSESTCIALLLYLTWGLDSQANFTSIALRLTFLVHITLSIKENGRLTLKRTLSLAQSTETL